MDKELTKAEISLIAKLLGAITITGFRDLITKYIIGIFISSHNDTNAEFNLTRSKPDPLALDYLRERETVLSDKTKSKLEGDLKFQIIEGLKANESITQLTKRMGGIFRDMLPYELERLARTESITAMNAGRQSAYEKSDVVKFKTIIGAKDKRLCALCRRMRGQIQEVEKPFVDPKNLDDSWMYPPFHPNGRCSTIPVMRLPDKTITISGQTYLADKVLGKVEIPVGLLKSQYKTDEISDTKEVWVNQTAKRKGHWRNIKIKGDK